MYGLTLGKENHCFTNLDTVQKVTQCPPFHVISHTQTFTVDILYLSRLSSLPYGTDGYLKGFEVLFKEPVAFSSPFISIVFSRVRFLIAPHTFLL